MQDLSYKIYTLRQFCNLTLKVKLKVQLKEHTFVMCVVVVVETDSDVIVWALSSTPASPLPSYWKIEWGKQQIILNENQNNNS